ncbi:rCG44838 [Rattus norvegicus]|uniref:RCG44838 n=1 Tax=Rattus norvegicus TaxID=10116 RepID=A6I515_RAT|nr:rCG44838 [Rattus norvegicus]
MCIQMSYWRGQRGFYQKHLAVRIE